MKRIIVIFLLSTAALLPCATVATLAAASPAAGIENVGSGASAYGGNGRITLIAGNHDAQFSIYSVTGQLIKTVRVGADQRLSVDVPKGFYVVKCSGQWSRKVVVK